ncbi:MAG: baseplate J/gp47 family protein [Chloroflexi bacterium]|nr:baseplate J/gp47 family protein [Chloroflexota bacterium]
MSGITATGFEIPTTGEILDAMSADVQAALSTAGVALDLSPEQPLGQLLGIQAAKMRELWEAMATVYSARDPANANLGVLDALCALSGVERREATRGIVVLSVTLGAGVTLPAGSIAHVAGQPSNQWRTVISITNPTGAPAVLGIGAESTETGRHVANAGSITSIATPVSGWTTVTNVADATPGADVESDPALRMRRVQELQTGGSSPLDAIRAELGAITGVTQVVVFENTTNSTNADGLPAHSIEAMVLGGTEQAVAEGIWRAKAAGIETHGNASRTIVDASGASRTVRYSRPVAKNIYVEVYPVIDAARYAGEAAVKAAVLAYGNALLAGQAVRIAPLIAQVMAVPGVVDVTLVLVGFSADSVSNANLSIELRRRAVFDSGRITVQPPTFP